MRLRALQQALALRLMLWSLLSIAVGLLLQKTAPPFWRAFGQQTAGWGAIDGAIALAGWRGGTHSPPPPAQELPELRKLRALLWGNAGLDLLYIAVGLLLWRQAGPARRGHGAAVVLQGLFLAIFDWVHARATAQLEKQCKDLHDHQP
ncbi:MAG: DUF6992 family protein [Caldilinea sp.]|jgi:hypothetical protein